MKSFTWTSVVFFALAAISIGCMDLDPLPDRQDASGDSDTDTDVDTDTDTDVDTDTDTDTDVGGMRLREGRLRELAPGPTQSGSVRLREGGLIENGMCNGALCVRGGLVP